MLTEHFVEETLMISLWSFTKVQGRREAGETGAVCPGAHSARGPILTNLTSIMQKCFQP